MIQYTIRNTMDRVRLTVFRKNLQTYSNKVSDPDLQIFVDDWRDDLCTLELDEEHLYITYHDPELELLRKLSV